MSNIKNSTTVYTTPSTPEQRRYYSIHGGKRGKYKAARIITQFVWGLLAVVGLDAILSTLLSTIPYIRVVSLPISAFLVFTFHALMAETGATFWYDRADDKDGDGNTKDEADSSPLVPIVLLIALVAADFYGARQWQYNNIDGAKSFNFTALDSTRDARTATEKAAYDANIASIEKRYTASAATMAASYDAQIRQWNARTVYSDNDRAFVSRNIASISAKKEAAIAKVLAGKEKEITDATNRYNRKVDAIAADHQEVKGKGNAFEQAEQARVEAEKQAAHKKSYYISILLAVIFLLTQYAEIRINCKSGIFPVRHYTALHAHGGFFEKFWNYVVVDTFDRQSHRLTVWLHSRLNNNARQLSDFDMHLFEAPTLPSGNPYTAQEYRQHAPTKPGAPPPPPPAPSAPAFSPEEEALVNKVKRLWKKVLESGDPNDQIETWETRRELLENHGIVAVAKESGDIRLYRERISFGELEKRHPLPKIRAFAPVTVPAPTAPATATDNTAPQNAVTQHTHTVTQLAPENQGETAKGGKSAAKTETTDVVDGWFTNHLTGIQREPGNLDNPAASKASVVGRLHRRMGFMLQGLRDGKQPSQALKTKAANYLRGTVIPALAKVGEPYPSMQELLNLLEQ